MAWLDTLFELGGAVLEYCAKESERMHKDMDRKIRNYEREMGKTVPKNSYDYKKYEQARSKIDAYKASMGNKTLDEWDREWKYIGMLKDANLTPYNHCVGLYKHVVNGEVKYIGRAIELYNGGFRKRLSDYRRASDSARKHTSGRTINENLDKIQTYILVVGDTDEAIEVTKRLEHQFIARYGCPEWNKQLFSRK